MPAIRPTIRNGEALAENGERQRQRVVMAAAQ
jgi:hypothetical protein